MYLRIQYITFKVICLHTIKDFIESKELEERAQVQDGSGRTQNSHSLTDITNLRYIQNNLL